MDIPEIGRIKFVVHDIPSVCSARHCKVGAVVNNSYDAHEQPSRNRLDVPVFSGPYRGPFLVFAAVRGISDDWRDSIHR